MGISFHQFKLVQLAKKEGPLGDVLTFGRQNLHVSQSVIQAEFGDRLDVSDDVYADNLLIKGFGASSVSSVDYSAYEGATYVGDFNRPFDLDRQFDTVIDSGTLEHVFDVAAGFRNAIKHCKVGGRIMHALPSNSDCGHGLYQISPELMLALYSEKNGFRNTAVYVVKVMDRHHWWRVLPARPGSRIMANSLSTTYVFCTTEKVAEVTEISVQQSDYEHAWESGSALSKANSRSVITRAREMFVGSAFSDLATLGYRTWMAKTGLTRFNPHLSKVAIDSL